MNNYRVTLEVDYVIKATSLAEAMKIVNEDTEHPLIGGVAIGYCDSTRVIGGSIVEGKGK
jgi:hypothetical protein